MFAFGKLDMFPSGTRYLPALRAIDMNGLVIIFSLCFVPPYWSKEIKAEALNPDIRIGRKQIESCTIYKNLLQEQAI